MCSCDAEFKPQPVAVDNAVTHPPTEMNQMTSDNVDDTEYKVTESVVDENSNGNKNNPIGCELCLLLAHHWRICW